MKLRVLRGSVFLAAGAWSIPHYLGKNASEMERKLIFDEAPVQTVEALRLSD